MVMPVMIFSASSSRSTLSSAGLTSKTTYDLQITAGFSFLAACSSLISLLLLRLPHHHLQRNRSHLRLLQQLDLLSWLLLFWGLPLWLPWLQLASSHCEQLECIG